MERLQGMLDNRNYSRLYDKKYTEYQLKRGWIRRAIRTFYLNHALKHTRGKAIDFGCGTGALLKKLPPGSRGYDINPSTVDYCRSTGLDVKHYRPNIDRYQLSDCTPGDFETFILSHVMEHLENPVQQFQSLMNACRRIDIKRVILIIPGEKGFQSDPTHRTFIDMPYLIQHHLTELAGYGITRIKYFPLDTAWPGKYFPHHELMVLYEQKGAVN